VLAELPADVFKAEAGSQLISLYWGERGGEAELARVGAALDALA
jgi:hypothetical protein